MPHYLLEEKHKYPVLVYEAPIDEKTKELRKAFDVDEKTGYPRHYNWRNLAKLGSTYDPSEPFEKWSGYRKETGYATKLTFVCFSAFVTGLLQLSWHKYYGRGLYAKPHIALGGFSALTYIFHWAHEKSIEQSGRKNAIYLDYIKKHPERFGPIHRPKMREVLFHQQPLR